MRTRLAIHFGFATFAVVWALVLISDTAEVDAFLITVALAAGAALVGWLSASPSGSGWSALRAIGWAPLVAGAVCGAIDLVKEGTAQALDVAAVAAVSSLAIMPLFVVVALCTRPMLKEPG